MDINNGTNSPTDTRVSSGGGSGMTDPPETPVEWSTILPAQTLHLDLKGRGPWKVEFRLMKGGRRKIVSEIAQTPHDLVELIETDDEVDVRITRPRTAASR